MGLLDQIVGGIAGNALGRSPLGGRGGGMGAGGGGGGVLMALLPVVLSMLANRSSAGGGSAGASGILGGLFGSGGGLGGGPGGGGGLGGLGGLGGGGGLGGLLEQFTRKGYGQHATSWVGTGANEPLTPDAVADVFGHDDIAQIAQQAGVSPDEERSGLAELLPDVVDHFTPHGQVPDMQRLSASVDDYMQRLNP